MGKSRDPFKSRPTEGSRSMKKMRDSGQERDKLGVATKGGGPKSGLWLGEILFFAGRKRKGKARKTTTRRELGAEKNVETKKKFADTKKTKRELRKTSQKNFSKGHETEKKLQEKE